VFVCVCKFLSPLCLTPIHGQVLSEEHKQDNSLEKELELRDRIHFLGFVPYTITYTASMRAQRKDPLTVEFSVNAALGVRLKHRLTFTQQDADTRVEDVVQVRGGGNLSTQHATHISHSLTQVSAPYLLRSYVTRTAQAAHTESFQRFPALFKAAEEGQGTS
jgi:hypothetical protein